LFLLGNYFKEGKKKTEQREIDDLLKEIKDEKGVQIDYFEIGKYTDSEIVDLIDKKIINSYLEKKTSSKSSRGCNEAHSCCVF